MRSRGESPQNRAGVWSTATASWWVRPRVIVPSAIAIAAAATALAYWASTGVNKQGYGGIAEALVGPLLAFAGAVVITGVVGVWVSAARDREQRRRSWVEQQAQIEREHRAFLESQIRVLWSVHDRLKTSAVLISAHRSAKTYSEQMQEIIAARTRLSDVEDTIRRQKEPLVTAEDFGRVQQHLRQAASFLHPLVDEYRKHYLEKVSYKQSVDEAINKQRVDDAIKDVLNDRDISGPIERSTQAWKALHDKNYFASLGELLEFGDLDADRLDDNSDPWSNAKMTKQFFLPLRNAIEVLVTCRVAPPTSPLG